MFRLFFSALTILTLTSIFSCTPIEEVPNTAQNIHINFRQGAYWVYCDSVFYNGLPVGADSTVIQVAPSNIVSKTDNKSALQVFAYREHNLKSVIKESHLLGFYQIVNNGLYQFGATNGTDTVIFNYPSKICCLNTFVGDKWRDETAFLSKDGSIQKVEVVKQCLDDDCHITILGRDYKTRKIAYSLFENGNYKQYIYYYKENIGIVKAEEYTNNKKTLVRTLTNFLL